VNQALIPISTIQKFPAQEVTYEGINYKTSPCGKKKSGYKWKTTKITFCNPSLDPAGLGSTA